MTVDRYERIRLTPPPVPPAGADAPPYTAADAHYEGARCVFCDGPADGVNKLIVVLDSGAYTDESTADPECWRLYLARDAEGLAARRAQACRAGFHRSSGWVADPGDPYGDAARWECVKGCGYVRWHPGYGINRSIAGGGAGD